ncbi:hypothetical protein GUITHDRAFT_145443 [Guillardia theta CCMP2712]|uniref:Homeobox domain-containing protein n=1 Tax=Guillardia theta (strain CCMP2712) TaxID=905079 RepID=L1ILZ9_GUITC|nr:hypothetical protein GUITHDRAFT_145443 [Guillardia theta CCMP2712]EKX36810.1 hypothetical protein GUITHDRAFT_145443 [Guillardia theta CCMP2712]|eukprot:XP_005823790.1 hypothetical protein GUITHDRAFT_145443 [Guillardia theta CCMP2712]
MLVSNLPSIDAHHTKLMLPNIRIFVSSVNEARTESASSFEDDCSCRSVTEIEASSSPLETGSPNSEDDMGHIQLAMDETASFLHKRFQDVHNTKLPTFQRFSMALKDSSLLFPQSFVPKGFVFDCEVSPKACPRSSLIDQFLGKRKADELWDELSQKKMKKNSEEDCLNDQSLFDEALNHLEESIVEEKKTAKSPEDVPAVRADICSGVALLAQIAAAQEYQMAAIQSNAFRSARDALLAGNTDGVQNRSFMQDEDKGGDGTVRVSKKSKKGRRHHSRDSVTILQLIHFKQKWLFANFRNPFPNLLEKQQLANATGLSVEQIVHWFNNARKRICSRVKVK